MSGPQCCENPPALNPVSGSGHVEKLGGLDAYISGSPDSSKLCVILISDVFGYEATNLRALADKVATSGFYVVVPDYFYGDPFDPSNQERPIPLWLKDHGADKGFEDTKPVIEALKSKGITAIGAAGMCWGAKVVVELSKQELVQAAVLLHPSLVTVDDIKGVKVPIAILGAEIDQLSPPALLKQFEEILAAKPEVNSYVKIHPKVAHGWTVRYKTDDPEAVKAAEEAHKEMLDWFVTYVK
ncbi:alpha/beta-Hydrolases superfamily protein [Raphanus sativus]|uniref:Endo-1,31,4-beta-D-glucanase n=1 Tax=Raphanus sativus TaxID=3726 RepID=A0A6J0NQ91_RAPSA|nr:endo-1,3;1,4-beta-D-glucanase [Raphanus sativus]KAJ4894401.1 alpha/beta-Hydrolases superfamily protein [Raphanus sativus]